MLKYALKRVLLMIPTILIVILIVYSIMSLTPGSPGRLILGQTAPQEAVDQLNEELGYNKPFLVRFANYILDICKGDFRQFLPDRTPCI